MTEIEAKADLRHELEQLLAQGLHTSGITVSRRTLRTLLERFLSGEIDRQQLTSWANSIEACDQVQYERPFEKLIADIVFEISSPEIHQAMDKRECRRLLGQLGDPMEA
jgi:hypothetical protein